MQPYWVRTSNVISIISVKKKERRTGKVIKVYVILMLIKKKKKNSVINLKVCNI